jgi:hypothetical protein
MLGVHTLVMLDTLLALFRILTFFIGIAVVVAVLSSAVRTFVLPRSARDPLTRRLFLFMRTIFDVLVKRSTTYHQRDAIMAFYAPIALLSLPFLWMALVLIGFLLMYWSSGLDMMSAFRLSESSLLTLGYQTTENFWLLLLMFAEGIIGMTLIALLISYLPTIYSSFSRREAAVSMLEVRAGSPPSAVTLMTRFHSIGNLEDTTEFWRTWESWFAELEETHTSLAVLPFFRSPHPERSWITAAGAVLDSASLYVAALDVPPQPSAQLCIRAGYLALRHIADFFRVPHNADPKPDDPISITRYEFDDALDQLAAEGVPLKADRDQAWRDFAGWRVNYDTVLLVLAGITMAPYAPWSSDRSRRRPNQRGLMFRPKRSTATTPTIRS